MKNKTTIYLAIACGVLAILYFFKDKIFSLGGGNTEGNSALDVPDTLNESNVDLNPQPPTDTSGSVILKSGVSSTIAERGQNLINTIIYVCRTTGGEYTDNYNRKAIASLKALQVDGVWGAKSSAAVKTITGKSTSTLTILHKHLAEWMKRKENPNSEMADVWNTILF